MKTIFLGAIAAAMAGCAGGGGAYSGQGAGSPDETACIRAVQERAATSDVSVLSYETSEANNLVMLRDGYDVTWRCLVNDARVVELNASY